MNFMEYAVLPREYWEKQDYLLYAYDVIGDMLRQADRKKLTGITFDLTNDEQVQSFSKAEDMFEWMDTNGLHDSSLKLFESHVFFSLLKDFCYYVFESISCAERGKVTVAYTLLRKPIRDNLLYLEWLLSDKEEFYNKFLYGNVSDFDLSNYKVFTKDRISEIVKSASQKSYMGKAINTNNLVYRFRFNNSEDIGLQRIWNQSMHLVTTSPNYTTDAGNLNFIFADQQIWKDYWNYYYTVMPQIMAYVIEICEALFLNVTSSDDFELLLNRTIRFAKYAKVQGEIEGIDSFTDYLKQSIALLGENCVVATMKCEHCSEEIEISHEIVMQMIDDWNIICPHCKQSHNICKYYADISYNEK
jgi:hypothetical protein